MSIDDETESFNLLEKVYVWEEQTYYPAVIVGFTHDGLIQILKFDEYIWRRVDVYSHTLSKRSEDFSDFIFRVRKSLLANTNFKFDL